MAILDHHKILEKNATLLLVFSFLVVTIGGIVEIAPLFYLENTIEKVEGVRPYTPLELTGRDIYVREGCYVCHSQMIRTLRDEVERYGPYSLAVESKYDHPMLWGSKRTGPDLARLGGKYSDDWQLRHLADPRALEQCIAATEAYRFLGSPEGELAIVQACLYCATAPKSNRAYMAQKAAWRSARSPPRLPMRGPEP